MHSQRQLDSPDVIGGGNAASGVPRWAGRRRTEQRAGRLGGGTAFRRYFRRRPLAQPLRIGSGFVGAGFHATGQGLGEHERGGGLELAAEQIGGTGRLESQGPPVLATRADLGEFHLAPRLLAPPSGGRRALLAGQREPADAPPLAYRLPARWVAAVVAGRAEEKGPLLPELQAPAGAASHLQDSQAPAVGLHLQRTAPANLHRQPGQPRIQQVGVLA
jgi:hypothetical protein